MARYTSLYQSPRSPLIQGRTRWERPLWQAWLAGVAVVVVWLAAWAAKQAGWFVVPLVPLFGGQPLLYVLALVFGTAAAGTGALIARTWGWNPRWVVAVVFGVAGALLANVVYLLLGPMG